MIDKLTRKIQNKIFRLRYQFWNFILTRRSTFAQLNSTQELFCQWNAERFGISLKESRNRYLQSWNLFPAGHSGPEFLLFCELSQKLFGIFFQDDTQETFDIYKFHEHLHFLRMLSYTTPDWNSSDPIIQGLSDHKEVTILDFGCGLAQRSRALADLLTSQGKKVHLVLADIPTIRKSFLIWIGEKTGIQITFLDCTKDAPRPDLPPCEVCIVLEFFEHVHEPILYLRKITEALLPNGFMLTSIGDHEPGSMHPTPDLASLREELGKNGYTEIKRNVLFRKRISGTEGK